ncbi:MAG: 50S ribosomal protein L4 [bacterium]|nr:50S ribosomal protein L4 [Acidimicrobiia bacterium]MCY4651393.1 50S ribosomal protein L4 [bacterium]
MAELTAPLYGGDGSLQGERSLDPQVFGVTPNLAVLHQVVTAQMAGKRSGTASTKTRAEVRGGGRKPWRQKGTGRARHGSIRSPMWRGGGVAHGPKPRSYHQKTPAKMRRLALRSALSSRASEGAVYAVAPLDWETPRTKAAVALLDAMGLKGKTLVVMERASGVAQRSFRNIPTMRIVEARYITPYDVLWARDLLFCAGTLEIVEGVGRERESLGARAS